MRINDYSALRLFQSNYHSTNKIYSRNKHNKTEKAFQEDTLSLSDSMYGKIDTSLNRKLDKSIDLKKYIKEAKESNLEAIENAGNKIDKNAVKYTSAADAMIYALEDKYSKLVAEAKNHSDPEAYIKAKYSNMWDSGLSIDEKGLARTNELWMLKKGTVSGFNSSDSLFRGVSLNGKVAVDDRLQFERKLINKQVSNILKAADIDSKAFEKGKAKLTVDPYNYHINVTGVDEKLKSDMEKTLNVGENGKYLFYHISKFSSQDNCNSVQVSKNKKLKYHAYHSVKEYTGFELGDLKEKDGAYYTDDNVNVLELVNKGIDKSDRVPLDFKMHVKNIMQENLSKLAKIGWNNIDDMFLNIFYTNDGLRDYGQDVIFDGKTTWHKNSWTAVI